MTNWDLWSLLVYGLNKSMPTKSQSHTGWVVNPLLHETLPGLNPWPSICKRLSDLKEAILTIPEMKETGTVTCIRVGHEILKRIMNSL